MNDKQYRDLAAMSVAGHLVAVPTQVGGSNAPERIAVRAFDFAEALVEERRKRDAMTSLEEPPVAPWSMLSPERARLLSDALGRYPEIGILPLDECADVVRGLYAQLLKGVDGVTEADTCAEQKAFYQRLALLGLRGAVLWQAEERYMRVEKST